MTMMNELERKLQKAERKQAMLYLFCNFISLMLTTAYAAMMFSPTVLNILPEGGDSRKQMFMIFALSLFGCIIFTIYASGLFFRKKSKQLGILMALGASKKQLASGLFREVFTLSASSSLLGILAGFPFVWLLWNAFRIFLVDTPEMALHFNFTCLFISFPFFLLVVLFSCITAWRYLQKTNIMDVIHEEHKNEPVRELGRWCGPVGILLLLGGAILGYSAPSIYLNLFHKYPSALLNLFYFPVFIGLYMIMLHTVVHGWVSRRKHPYRNIIARSMMKFQGKQTVGNLLVSTVLIAGACFGIFYIPMLGVGSILETKNRLYDYAFHYRADQNVPQKEDIISLAANNNIKLKDWKACDYISLGLDGTREAEEPDGSFHYEYVPLAQEGKFLSEDAFETMTGMDIEVRPGTYYGVTAKDEGAAWVLGTDASKLTNMVTRKELPVKYAGLLYFDLMQDQVGYYVLNNEDYKTISQSLTKEWMGKMMYFNVDGADSYTFARKLFLTFVDSFGPECETVSVYDRVAKIAANENGEIYWGDTDAISTISFSHPDATEFRQYWTYMPKIRILDQNDFLQNFAVFLMMFLFIAIVCMLAALIISYTRCQTIALNNRYIFLDLQKLGASPEFLVKEVKNQCGTVFTIPSLIGMTAMFFLYSMIMFANDGKFTEGEIVGLLACLGILILFALIIYGVYHKTMNIIKRQLGIHEYKPL